MQGDVFGLNRIYDIQTENIRTGLDLSIPGREYGYLGGGFPAIAAGPGSHTWLSTLERIDFTTETTSNSLRLPTERDGRSGSASNFYGYIAGGSAFATRFSTIDRVEFASETVSTIPAVLQQERREILSTQNAYYAYFAGGGNPTAEFCTINRLDFSTETRTTPSSSLPTIRIQQEGTVQNNSYAYFGGGYIPTVGTSCTIDRLDFSSETVTRNLNFPEVRGYGATISSKLYGYFGGGYNAVSNVCTIVRLDFSSETSSILSSQLSVQKSGLAGNSSRFYGYMSGGGPPTPLAVNSVIDRIDFSTDTVTTPSTKLAFGRSSMATVDINQSEITKITPRYINWSESATKGYILSSYSSPTGNAQQYIDFSTEVTNTISLNRPYTNTGWSALVSNSSFGYSLGGSGRISSIHRLDFSSESFIKCTTTLPVETYWWSGISTKDYGYGVAGSLASGKTSNVRRIDFTTETLTTLLNKYTLATSGTSSISGTNISYTSLGENETTRNITNFDHSSESFKLIPALVSKSLYSRTSVKSNYYGYFGGGYGADTPSPVFAECTIDRLDFSTETTTALSQQLTQGRSGLGGVYSNAYGYFAGGYYNPSFNDTTKIDRLDFSTETISSPSNFLVTGMSATTGGISAGAGTRRVGKATYGYFGAGSSASSTVDRLDFSTETVAPSSVITKISTDKEDDTMTISSNYAGYFVGGWKSPNNAVSTIDRLDFSSETNLTLSSRLSQDRGSGASISNSSYGYLIGGYATYSPFVPRCTIDRFDFSTETANNPGKNLSTAVGYLCGLQNSNYGYSIGGQLPPDNYVCTISRLDFSTETISNPGKYTNTSRANHIGSSNNSYGYLHGGYGGSPTFYICTIERLDFSTELVSNLPSKTSVVRADLGSASNNLYGYFGAGANFSSPITSYSTIDRLDFASETVTVPSQKLTVSRWGVRGFANSQ